MRPRHRPASPAWLLLLLLAGCSTNRAPAVTLPLADGTHVPGPIRLTDSAGGRHLAPEGALTRAGMVIFVRDGERMDSIPARTVIRVERRDGVGGAIGFVVLAVSVAFAFGIVMANSWPSAVGW